MCSSDLRAPFYNPAGEFVTALTNWLVRPARRVIPGLYGIDLSSLVLAWIFDCIMLFFLQARAGGVGSGNLFLRIAVYSVFDLARQSLYLLIGVVFVQAILSWVAPYNPLSGALDALTRPFYNIFRRFIPPIANIDLSPIFVLLAEQIMLIVLDAAARQAVMLI